MTGPRGGARSGIELQRQDRNCSQNAKNRAAMTMKTKDLEAMNAASIAHRDSWRRALDDGTADPAAWQHFKHQKPYFGFYDCTLADATFAMFSANDDQVVWELFWTGTYEEEVVDEWVRMVRDADVVLDIGAYTGCMALLACAVNPNCRVVCYEPMLRTVERLKINVAANALMQRITIEPYAVSSEAKKLPIRLTRTPNFLSTGNSIDPKPQETFHGTVDITTVVLDDQLHLAEGERVSCIKLDVEGHELEALRGMDTLVRTHKPTMIVEVWPAEQVELVEWMTARGYSGTQLRGMNWIFRPDA
jgi:FkbM family methyltransferase